MAPLQKGDKFPDGVVFDWVPIENDDPLLCGVPQNYNASKEFAGKKVVLISVPGAFTPTCQARHIPPFLEKSEELKSKGVELVVVIGYNDGWVMNAWGKVNGVKGTDPVLFMGDIKTFFSKNYAFPSASERNSRWAMVIEKDGTISYSEYDGPGQLEASTAEAVLAKL
ncbi:AhpC/TSA family protein-like protein [Patellaria atrata CBS 101060]|uniref:AhpC/TSA family protein-like protein n=1 Tax=Patellaria atrata CBS 101060 TaxID=1346257 RepID=A0A9P4SC31_9PEZI|nr:AhpC/TSA family protein-like protein [Patellaria atrata CBS 101060]